MVADGREGASRRAIQCAQAYTQLGHRSEMGSVLSPESGPNWGDGRQSVMKVGSGHGGWAEGGRPCDRRWPPAQGTGGTVHRPSPEPRVRAGMGVLMLCGQCGRVGNKLSSMPTWLIYDFMIWGARMEHSGILTSVNCCAFTGPSMIVLLYDYMLSRPME